MAFTVTIMPYAITGYGTSPFYISLAIAVLKLIKEAEKRWPGKLLSCQ
jgi:hypothetical protein